MTSDLIERLRRAKSGAAPFSLWDEAADKIAAQRELIGELVGALDAQYKAINLLFAELIKRDVNFSPSKSGKPWEYVLQAQAALAKSQSHPAIGGGR